MPAQFFYPVLTASIADPVDELMRILLQTEVLFLTGLGIPDVFVCLGDDPVIGKFSVGVLSVKPCARRGAGVLGQREQAVPVHGSRDLCSGDLKKRRHDVAQLSDVVAYGRGFYIRQHIFSG